MESSTEVPFVELLAKTNCSFLEGASHPEEMVVQAAQLGYRSLGVADRNGVYGAPRAHTAASPLFLKLLVGAELSLTSGESVSLISQNREGYGNLCELLTTAHTQNDREAVFVSASQIAEKADKLFAILPSYPQLAPIIPTFKEAFGNRLFFAVSQFREGRDPFVREEAEQLSNRFQIPCIATNRPLFHTPRRKPVQDVLTCIQHTCTLKDAGFRLQPNHHRYLKSGKQIQQLFPTHPEWLTNTVHIAEQCNFSLSEIRYRYPVEWIPKDETAHSYLDKLVWEGAKRRFGETLSDKIVAQLNHELALVKELEYSDYFLTIWDIVQFARRKEILCQGRGSAANSCICYVLGITSIDPIRMDLLFERFISRERNEPPDIDIDFEHERREEVIQYLYERYGRDRAAISAEVICFRRRSALREVAKVFEIPTVSVEKLLTLTHREKLSDFTPEEISEKVPELPVSKVEKFFLITQEILSFPRHLGTHVGGFVLCQEKLSRNVPIEKAAMEGRTIIQWDKNDLDALGFVRVDILGLGILTAIRKCFEYIETIYGKKLTLATIPAEDPAVYQSVCDGDTVGVFQIESRAQMNMLPRLKPRNFFDLVVEISIVRPGPIQGQMVHPYLRRRSGKEPIIYEHPELEAILKKTFGVPLFQEQIMKIAMQVAGFTPGEADILRRLMGTWRREGKSRLSAMGTKFIAGLMAKGIRAEFAERIFSQIEGFAEYGFPESHAASFAILAYATSYLKLYYPDAFVAALLNSQPMGFYNSQSLIHDAERHGVKMLPIDINASRWDDRLEEKMNLRLGFRHLRGFPERTGRAIERLQQRVRFHSFDQFVAALKEAVAPHALTKRELFALAGGNAFESVGFNRRAAIWHIQALSIQDSPHLFAGDSKIELPREEGWEAISLDYEAQGVSLFSHPMAFLRRELEALGVTPSVEVLEMRGKKRVRVAGIVICRQMPPTASGVLFITLEDEHGFINLVIWRKVYELFREVLITKSFLICDGVVEKAEDGQVTHVIVERAEALLGAQMAPVVTHSHDFH